MKRILNNIRYYTREYYIKVSAKFASEAIARAKADTSREVLHTALHEFHRARRLDWIDITQQIKELGSGMERHFEGTDPAVAYDLGKQVAVEIIEARVKVS